MGDTEDRRYNKELYLHMERITDTRLKRIAFYGHVSRTSTVRLTNGTSACFQAKRPKGPVSLKSNAIYKKLVSRARTSKIGIIPRGNLEHANDSKKKQNCKHTRSGLMKERRLTESEGGSTGQITEPNEGADRINVDQTKLDEKKRFREMNTNNKRQGLAGRF